ncbi:brachyurin-like isoform X1 [Danaus plexippus]|uniref:brachyurin-like isoform X1 n=1 Tax=Danaus plexippus TaxID=13037 RepID=UPI002AAF8204|nr:brachyurin-like isoform X1 [Danaus plexippus]
MRVLLLFVLQLCGCVYTLRGYHEDVGIPKARRLMILEMAPRIIGGRAVSAISQYPYQAGIVTSLTTGKTSLCGGSLISSTRVITAAHCWNDGQSQALQFTVVLGTLTVFSGGTRITTRDVTVHPQWNTKAITNDIAIVKFPTVALNNNIQVISLPSASDVSNNFAGMTATVTGYGKISDSQASFPPSTTLHHVSLNIITNAVCQRSFDLKLDASHLCTSGTNRVGTCDGDSGGPLMVTSQNKKILVGIVSFGFGDSCSAGYPSVYTRVTSFLRWIQTQM